MEPGGAGWISLPSQHQRLRLQHVPAAAVGAARATAVAVAVTAAPGAAESVAAAAVDTRACLFTLSLIHI